MKGRKTQLLTLVLSLVGAAACNIGAAPTDPNAPPAGCQRTLCDVEHDYCQNPSTTDYCSECFDACSSDIYSNPDCASECDGICQEQNSRPQSDPCGDALTACRKSKDDAICVDDIGDPAPDGTPCNDTASLVSCKCNAGGASCGQAIYDANPACKQCDDRWVAKCQATACPNERATASDCMSRSGCTDTDCIQCSGAINAWNDCLNAAQEDPSDPGGCNSGSHACWTQPYCNKDGTSSK